MRVEQTNELEERRVIRLLAGLADDVPALSDDEIRHAVGSASALAPSSRHIRWRQPTRRFSAVAAAAVVALAFLVQFPGAHSSSAASGNASIATFPQGDALQLLLSAGETR